MKIKTSEEFINAAIDAVYDMASRGLCPTDDVKFTRSDVYEVTHAFVLGNQKGMFSTTLQDGRYYEVTYNDAKGEMYVDCYAKLTYDVVK